MDRGDGARLKLGRPTTRWEIPSRGLADRGSTTFTAGEVPVSALLKLGD